MDASFKAWLEVTRELQRLKFGCSPEDLDDVDKPEFVRWNVLAATDELHEYLHEVPWKPWKTIEEQGNDRDAAIGELVDVLHFIANLLVLHGVTPEELAERYEWKVIENLSRRVLPTQERRT